MLIAASTISQVSPDLLRWREEIFKRSGVEVGKWMKPAPSMASSKTAPASASDKQEEKDEESFSVSRLRGVPRGPLGMVRQVNRNSPSSSSLGSLGPTSSPPASVANGNRFGFLGGRTASRASATPALHGWSPLPGSSKRGHGVGKKGEPTELEVLADMAKRTASAAMNAAQAAKDAVEAAALAPSQSSEREEAMRAAKDCAAAAATASTTAALLAEEVAMRVAAFVASNQSASLPDVLDEASSFLKARHFRHYWGQDGEGKRKSGDSSALEARTIDVRQTAKRWSTSNDGDSAL